jgi:hypothetical protein
MIDEWCRRKIGKCTDASGEAGATDAPVISDSAPPKSTSAPRDTPTPDDESCGHQDPARSKQSQQSGMNLNESGHTTSERIVGPHLVDGLAQIPPSFTISRRGVVAAEQSAEEWGLGCRRQQGDETRRRQDQATRTPTTAVQNRDNEYSRCRAERASPTTTRDQRHQGQPDARDQHDSTDQAFELVPGEHGRWENRRGRESDNVRVSRQADRAISGERMLHVPAHLGVECIDAEPTLEKYRATHSGQRSQ